MVMATFRMYRFLLKGGELYIYRKNRKIPKFKMLNIGTVSLLNNSL